MLGNAKIVTFAATQNADAAKQFYMETLGLNLVADEPFALVFNANGTMLRLQKVESFQPQPFTTLGWEVANLKATIMALKNRGIQFEHFPGIPKDDLGVTKFDDGTKVAWFRDPDGNLVSLIQF